MQNGGAMLSRLPTRQAKALTSRLQTRGSRRVTAIQGSQFQKDEPAVIKGVPESRGMRRSFSFGFRISDFGFRFAACPANGARKGTMRKMERTNRSCIARSPTIHH